MELQAFDFSQNITEDELLEHIRYYYTMSNIAMKIARTDKKEAMNIFKEIRKNLEKEYKEYHKVKNYQHIRKNKLYIQYVDNITNAFVKPTRVTSYDRLNSNLYDVHDYIDYDFHNFLNINEEQYIEEGNIDNYLGKKCNLVTKDYLVYQGMVDLKLFEILKDNIKTKSISIYDFERWNQIDIDNIRTIEILNNCT